MNDDFTNKLSEFLVDNLLNEGKIRKIIGIYPGRFQPAGVHHYKTYKWLDGKFDKAYVATSNKTDSSKSPLNFKEKKMIWTKHKVKNVVQVKNPYVCEEILKKYDPNTTAVIYIFGEKDAGRLKTTKADGSPAYYQSYVKNKGKLKPYAEHGYFIVAPHVSIKVLGGEVSGTRIRDLLGSPKYSDEQRKQAFKELFGWYDEKIYDYLTKKFATLFENKEIFEGFLKEYPKFKKFVNNIPTLLNEISTISALGKTMVDDGPSMFYPGQSYEGNTSNRAQQLGYDLLDYVVGKHGLGRNADYREWGKYAGPVPAVSFYPAGDIDANTAMNQIDYEKSQSAHTHWVNFIDGVAETAGYKLVDFLGSEKSIRKKDEQGDEDLKSGTNTIDTDKAEDDEEIDKGVEGHAITKYY